MAHENPCLVRQREDLLDRIVEHLGRAAGKVAPRRAEIWHEQRIAHKGGITDHIGQAGGRMTGRVQHIAAHLADHEGIALGKKLVELAAVALELRALVEDLAECILHNLNPVADADLAPDTFLQVWRCGQMVGMDMGFQQPLHVKALGLDESDDLVCGFRICPTRSIIEIQHGIDDGAGATRRVFYHIGHGICGFVEKGCDIWFHLWFSSFAKHI